MKSNFLVGLATVGYVLFFLLAMLGMSDLNMYYPTGLWFWTAGCALLATIFGTDKQRRVGILGLIIPLSVGIYCWHHNFTVNND